MAITLKVLSAGAVKRGVAQVCAAFERDTGTKVEVEFTQAPLLRQRIAAGEFVDVLVATPSAMDEFAAHGAGAVGLAQISEVMVMIDKGCAVKLVAPLPDAIQNLTTYYAAAATVTGAPEAAAALTRALTSDTARKLFAATGID